MWSSQQKSIFALHTYNNYTTINSRYFNPLEVSKSLNRPYDVDFATLVYNVNPGLINPKRLFNWGDTNCDNLEGTPTINKPWF